MAKKKKKGSRKAVARRIEETSPQVGNRGISKVEPEDQFRPTNERDLAKEPRFHKEDKGKPRLTTILEHSRKIKRSM